MVNEVSQSAESHHAGHPELVSGSHPVYQPTPDTNTLIEHIVRFTEKKEQYIIGNRNNFVFQLACNFKRKKIPFNDGLNYILAHYNYDQEEVVRSVTNAYNTTETKSKNSPNLELSTTKSSIRVKDDSLLYREFDDLPQNKNSETTTQNSDDDEDE